MSRFIGVALIALAGAPSILAQGQYARTVEDRERVTVMEFGGVYDHQPESNVEYELAVRKAIAREFFRTHADDYDFLVVFSRFPYELGRDSEGADVGGRYYGVKNDVEGIGQPLFDNTNAFGSNGRLQGFIDMGVLSRLATDPSDPKFEQTLSILAHEFLHRWAAHVRFRDANGSLSEALLGRDRSHWSFLLNSRNSVLYGNDWRDNGNGTFTSIGRSRSFFSPLDLYLMGVLEGSQVPPFALIQNGEIQPERLSEVGVSIPGTSRTIAIDDIIAAEGPRTPPAADAPKRFKMGFILLVRPGEQADGLELRQIDTIREAFATRALILSGGKVDVQIFPDAPPPSPLPAPPPSLPPASGPRPGPVDLVQGIDWLLSRQRADGGWGDSIPTQVRDSSAAIAVLGEVPAAYLAYQEGVAWLTSLPDGANVDMVSRRLIAIAPQYSAPDVALLAAAQNADGGWGLDRGFTSDPFDTALAATALGGASARTVQYLLSSRNADGGWPMRPGGASSVQPTLAVLRLARRHPATTFDPAVTAAIAWLQTRQRPDGGFGDTTSTVYDTADAVLYLVRTPFPASDLARAADFLRQAQLADGSWNESVHQTALAVRALKLADLPNVSASGARIAFAPESPVEGQPVAITASVSNDGVQDASNLLVRVYDGNPAAGGTPIGADISIPSLPGLTELPVAVHWDTTSKPGVHTIVVAVDPDGALPEYNEADNNASKSLTVRSAPVEPDLVVYAGDISVTPVLLQAVPQQQTLAAKVTNAGQTAVAQAQVWLYDGNPASGGTKIGETLVGVPGRASATATFSFTVPTSGEHRFFVVLDPANAVVEDDETNNQSSATLPVQSTLDFYMAPGSIAFSQNPASLGTDVTLSALAGNQGTTDAFSVAIRAYVDDPQGAVDLGTQTLDLPAGGTQPVTFVWRAGRPLAQVPIVVQVDPNNAFPETNEHNNRQSAPLTVASSTLANIHVTYQGLQVSTPVLQSGSATISIPVHNTGFADAAGVTVAFYLGVPGSGGVQIGSTQTISSLPPGAQTIVSTTWEPIAGFGSKLVYVVTDVGQAIEEFDEDDNTAFVNVTVLSLPDPSVASGGISFSPAFPKEGDPIGITAAIVNEGDRPAADVLVRFFDGDPAAGGVQIGADQIVAQIGGHAQASAQVVSPAQSGSVKNVFVVVDPANHIVELDESNNTASRTVGVQDASLFFSNLFFSPNGDEVRDTTELFFRLTGGTGATTATAIDKRGRPVRSFALEGAPLIEGRVPWDGRDGLGRVVPDGSYSFSLAGAGGELAASRVVVDNNASPVTSAIGTKYLVNRNLTCGLKGAVGAGYVVPFREAGWLSNDAGLVTWYPTAVVCMQSNGYYCTRYEFSSTPVGVYVVPPDGQAKTRITPDSWTVHPPAADGTYIDDVQLSPDGTKLAIIIGHYRIDFLSYITVGPRELWVLNTDGSGLRQIAPLPYAVMLAWSPDSSRLAYAVGFWQAPDYGTGYVVDLDGSGQTTFEWKDPAVPGTPVLYDLSWSPDGQHVLYSGEFVLTEAPTFGYRIYAIDPDGTNRRLVGNGEPSELSSLRDLMWLGTDKFAKLLEGEFTGEYFEWGQTRRVWLFSLAGGAPALLTPGATPVDIAAVSPDGRTIAFVNKSPDPNATVGKSTGISLVGATADPRVVYTPTANNLGVANLEWSADGRRLVFIEHVAVDIKVCTTGGGVTFPCPQLRSSVGSIDLDDNSARLLSITSSTDNTYATPLGLFPEGNAYLYRYASTTTPFTPEIRAIGLDDGTVATLFTDPLVNVVSFSKSGKYFLFQSGRDSINATAPCWKGYFAYDQWVATSLLNLSARFTFQRDGSQLLIRGTAEDLNFAQYRLEYAAVEAPDAWTSIETGDAPVIDDVLARWVPPGEGSFNVRLTVEDKAGNTRATGRRLAWGLAPSITNVVVAPRLFSPNGDGRKDAITIDYLVLGPVNLVFTIFDAQGNAVRSFTQSHPVIGPASVAWDGRSDAGQFVADGRYRIHVLDFDFFVDVDTSSPDVHLEMGGGLHVVPQIVTCVGPVCYALPGPRIDAPYHLLTGRVNDARLATWKLEVGNGANPAEWLFVDEGTGLLLGKNPDGTPKSPIENVTVRKLDDATGVVHKKYRLTATDQAGNTASVVTDFAPQELILAAWDGEPVPTAGVLEQRLGPHTLSVVQTIRAPIQLVLQYRLEGTAVWSTGPSVSAPPPSIAIAWDTSMLVGGRTYEVRLLAADFDGNQLASNFMKVHADLFVMTQLAADYAEGRADLRESLTKVELVTELDDRVVIAKATFTNATDFVAPFSSCELAKAGLEAGPVRFRGVGQSGKVYYSNSRGLTPECPKGSGGGGGLPAGTLLLAVTTAFGECGQPSPQRVAISLSAPGIIDGSQTLAIQSVPNGPFEPVANVTLPSFTTVIDTHGRAEGTYRVRATGEYIEIVSTLEGLQAVRRQVAHYETFVVDRAAPAATITYPGPNQQFCPVPSGNRVVVPVEGIATDPNFDHYVVEWGAGDSPTQWAIAFPLAGEEAESKIAKQGILANWNVTGLPRGSYTLRVKVFDRGGNVTCHQVTFTLPGTIQLTNLSADRRLVSPNGDGKYDTVVVSYSLDRAAPVTAKVFPSVNGAPGATPVRTIFANAQQLEGQNSFAWDGLNDAGTPVADGPYLVVVSTRDVCTNAADATVAIVVDNTPPDAGITAPAAGATVGVVVDIRGSVSDLHFKRYVLDVGAGSAPSEFTPLAGGPSLVTDGLLGKWSNQGHGGSYVIRLTAEDDAGNARQVLVPVTVPQEQPLVTILAAEPILFSPNADGRLDASVVRYEVAASSAVKLEIVDGANTPVKVLADAGALASAAYEFTWDGTSQTGAPVADGDYLVRLTAKSAADPNRTQTETTLVTVDTTAPAVTADSPVADAHLKGAVPVSGTIGDPHLESYSVAFGPAGSPVLAPIDQGVRNRSAYEFGTLQGLADGAYRVELTAFDRAQNRATKAVGFRLDNTAPVVALIAPAEGALAGGLTPGVAVRGSIVESHLEEWTLRYGSGADPPAWTTIASGTTVPATETLATWTVGALADGSYTLSLLASDKAGSTAEARRVVVVDNTPPTAVIQQPSEGAPITSAMPITGVAADAHVRSIVLEISEGVPASAFKYATLTRLATSIDGGTIHTVSSLPPDGVFTLRLTVEDEVGLKSAALRMVVVDRLPPRPPLALTAAVEARKNVRLDWTASPDQDVAGYLIYRNGVKATTTPVAGTTFLDQNLADGAYKYQVTAVDAAELESQKSNEASAEIDLTPPKTKLLSPPNGSAVSGIVDVQGTAASANDFKEYRLSVGPGTDPASLTLVRRSPLPITSGLLAQYDTSAIQSGPITVRLEAEDLAGNTGSDHVIVNVDNVPPAAPVLLSVTSAQSDVTVVWQANAESDLAGYLLYDADLLANVRRIVDGSLLPYLLTATTFLDKTVGDGVHKYHLFAVDTAGNFSAPSNTITVDIDTGAPRAAIVQPADGARTDKAVTLVASSSAADLKFVQFEFKAEASPSWTALGGPVSARPLQIAWDPVGLGLAFGRYQFRAVATDTHDNVDAAPPAITLVYQDLTAPASPAALSARVTATTVSLTWPAVSASDLAGYLVYRANVPGGPLNKLFSTPITATTYDDLNLGDARYTYVVVAVDTSANESAKSTEAPAHVYRPGVAVPAACIAASTVTLSGAGGDPDTTITLFRDTTGGPVTVATAQSVDGSFQFEGVALEQGANVFTVQGADAAGNVSRVSPPLTVTYDPAPAAPGSLAAAVTGFDVSLTWNAAAGAAGYNVYRDGVALIPTVNATSSGTASASSMSAGIYAAANAIDGNANTYWNPQSTEVAPWWQVTFAQPIAVKQVVFDWAAGFQPTDFEVQGSNGAAWTTLQAVHGNAGAHNVITLAVPYWTTAVRVAIAGPKAMYLREAEVFRSSFVTATTFADANVPRGRHTYAVAGVNACAVEGAAAPVEAAVGDVTPPARVLDLSASVAGSNVTLQWTGSADADLAGYNAYRKLDADWIKVNATLVPQSPAVDLNVPNGAYRYRVTAVDQAGNESDPSNEAAALVDVPPPAAPVALAVTAPPIGGALDLSWTPGDPAAPPAGYDVFRSLTEGGPYARITSTPLTVAGYRDAGLTNGTTYFYVVRANDAAGNPSGDSNQASGTPADHLAPAAPVLGYPTDAAHRRTMTAVTTPVAGYAEPGSNVTLLAGGLQVGQATALAAPQVERVDMPAVSLPTAFFGREARLVSPASSSNTNTLVFTDVVTRLASSIDMGTGIGAVAFSADGHRIAVVSGTTARIVDCVTGATLQTVSLPFTPSHVALSPDGARLALTEGGGLWTVDLATSLVTRRTSQFAMYPTWSPDSRLAAFISTFSSLQLFDTETGAVTTIDPTVQALPPSFSPDGSLLVYTGRAGGSDNVWFYDVTAKATSAMETDSSVQSRRRAVFSLDGGALAYLEQVAGKWRLRVRNLSTGAAVSIADPVDSLDSLFWMADGSLVQLDTARVLRRFRPAGHFQVPVVPLDAGENVLTAVVADASGNISDPAAPISLTRSTAGLPDLAAAAGDFLAYPLYAMPGETVHLSATIRNAGDTAASDIDVVLYDVSPGGEFTAVGPPRKIASLAPGAQAAIAGDWQTLGVSGSHRLMVVVDPLNRITEASETNNQAERTVTISAQGGPTAAVSTDLLSYQPGATVRSIVDVATPLPAADFTLEIAIEDAQGFRAATLRREPLPAFGYSRRTFQAAWSTAGILGGEYRVRAILERADGSEFSASAPFVILSVPQATAKVVTDRASYRQGEAIDILGTVKNTSPNANLTNLVALTQVFDAQGAERFRSEMILASILLGTQAQVPSQWSATAPGVYGVRFAIRSSSGELASATTSVSVSGGANVQGTVSVAPAIVDLGEAFVVAARASNTGTDGAAAQHLRLLLLDPDTQALVEAFDRTVDLPAGAGVAWDVTMSSSGLSLKRYTVLLRVESQTGGQALASALVEIADRAAPVVAITSPIDGAFHRNDVALAATVVDRGSGTDRVEYRIDDGPWTTMTAADLASGRFAATYPAAAATEGPRLLAVRARDKAGSDDTTSTSDANPASVVFTIDVTPPAIAIAGVEDGKVYTSPVTPVVSVTDLHATTHQIELNGEPFVSGTPIAAAGSYTLSVNAADPAGNTSTASVQFTIGAANRPPVATSASVTTPEDAPLTIVLAATDPDGDALTFEVTPPSNGSISGTAPHLTYTPNGDFHGSDSLSFSASDGVNPPVSAVVSIVITPVNDAPTAAAGPDQAGNEGITVTLDGTGSSDVEGDPLAYGWSQVAGPAVTLDLAVPSRPAFVTPLVPAAGATLTFRLVVSDGALSSAPAFVNVFVKNVNTPPIAHAGPDQRVNADSLVSLTGSASYDPDGEPLTYEWTQTAGRFVQLSNPASVSPSFTAPLADRANATLTFRLTVSDGTETSADTVDIVVEPVNHPPIADAGPDQVKDEGTLVTLDGSASRDPDGDVVTFRWQQISGIPVTLSDPTETTPTFVAPLVRRGGDLPEVLTFRLVVNDGQVDSPFDDVVVRITKSNAPPICSAARPSEAVLWPPNHKFVPIAILGISDPDRNPVSIAVTRVTQDEPVDGLGDGDTGPDAIVDGAVLLVRAERAGTGNGRVIQVQFTASDGEGGSCTGAITIGVPHSQKPGEGIVDDGQHYDATRK